MKITNLNNLDRKTKTTIAIVAIALLLCLIGTGVAIAKTKANTATGTTDTTEQVTTPTTTVAERTSVEANITFDLEGFDWSVPALLSVTDATGNTTYVAYETPDNAKLTLADGTYTVTGVSPITAEGAIYITSEPVTVDKTTEVIAITGVKLAPENVTDEQIAAITDAYSKAKDTGVVTESVTATITANAGAGAEARSSKTDEEKAQATESAKSEAETKHTEAVSEGGNSNANTSNSSNSGSANSGGNSNANTSTPAAHTHSWTPVYRTVHHDAVTHEEPVYETRTTSKIYCTAHNVPILDIANRWPDTGGLCPADKNCGANHQRVYSTEQVQTGTKTVTDKAAYDEQVVDHYTCNCGATK